MVGIAALSSLGQATVAVALIYAGVWLYDGARDRVEGLAARIDPIAMLLIAGLGLMLFLRELAALVLGIALRPCTGALFLLILTWRLDIDVLGILGAYVMGLGAFMVTGGAAFLAVAMRNGLKPSLPGFKGAAQLAASTEITVGALILLIGLSAASRLL